MMPTCDRPDFAALAIRCFQAQDYPERELIIIDDGCLPLPAHLLADPRVRYVRQQQRLSIGAKRNLACREAQGEIILQWDDDDWHGPGRIRRQVEPLLQGEAEITGLCETIVLDLSRFEFWQPSRESFEQHSFEGVHCGTLAYKRSVGEVTTYPDISEGEDVAFLRPALVAQCRLGKVAAREDFIYVRHGRNASILRDVYREHGACRIAPPRSLLADLPHYQRLHTEGRSGLPVAMDIGSSLTISRSESKGGLIRGAENAVGVGVHRSGWSYAVRALQRLELPLILDDFVEQTFCYEFSPRPHRRPWVGIFHCPPSMPSFATLNQHPQCYLATPAFRESQPLLRGAIALSQYLADWLTDRLEIPVLTIKHPSEPGRLWRPESLGSAQCKLLQVGFYLRNTLAIDQVPASIPFERARLLPSRTRGAMAEWEAEVALLWARLATRPFWPGVASIPCASNEEYDELLSSCIVLTEVFDASANNVIVECIARGTPLIVNRHPAVVEYVGADYPLLFDAIDEVPRLLADQSRILAAHAHLLKQRGEWLNADAFANRIGQFCRELHEERA